MKTITELRTELGKIFEGLGNGTVDVKAATEMNNSAGKMINTVKVQLEYAALRKETPKISFMKGE